MSITIVRKPLAKVGPAGQPWVYVCTSTNVGQEKFKFVVDIFLFEDSPSSNATVRLKLSPNEINFLIVDIRNILEQYVGADNVAHLHGSEYIPNYTSASNTATPVNYVNTLTTIPIHMITNFSMNNYAFKRFTVKFGEEYAASATDAPVVQASFTSVEDNGVFNGVVPYNGQQGANGTGTLTGGVNLLSAENTTFGGPFVANTTSLASFLTNAPLVQYIRKTDFMTVGVLAGYADYGGTTAAADWYRLKIKAYDASNQQVGTTIVLSTGSSSNTAGQGANLSSSTALTDSYKHLQYIGVGPQNLLSVSAFGTIFSNSDFSYYEIFLENSSNVQSSKTYRFVIQENDCKNYETIRLAWLNRLGAWDYYNFTKKSYREINIEKNTTKQERVGYRNLGSINMHRRSESVITVNAKQSIIANTDWVSEEESNWLQELYTSPEVYMIGEGILPGSSDTTAPDSFRQYVTPVIVTSDKYEKYTNANDKVVQYLVNIDIDDKVNVQNNQQIFNAV